VILLDVTPPERQFLEFLWPVCVTVGGTVLQVKFTIMEKDLRSYFPGAGAVAIRKRSVDEESVLKGAKEHLLPYVQAVPLDINKGVKALWEEDYIDSPEARWRNSRSTSRETMDEKYMIKKDQRAVYDKAKRVPLLQTLFRFVKDEDEYVSHFVVDPGNGLVRFPMFSARRDGTINVLAKILALN
jgi:hypothetical protein